MKIISAKIIGSQFRVILHYQSREYNIVSKGHIAFHLIEGTERAKIREMLQSQGVREQIIEETGASPQLVLDAILEYLERT